MMNPLFDFFGNPVFDKCFFTGTPVSGNEKIPVFGAWLRQRYQLDDQWLGMLNWNRVKYSDLYIPCAPEAAAKVQELEYRIQTAFESGYEAVRKLDDDTIFLWMSKILLGVLFHDVRYSIELGNKRNKPYALSPLLTRKFTDLHYQLQSLVRPVRWTVKPYSLVRVPVSYSKDVFNFRDETNKLNFSLGMLDFGLIACLQDFGANNEYHKHLLQQIGDTPLHAIQFEELCARFIYSNYLLQDHAGWALSEHSEAFVLSPARDEEAPVFNAWDDSMYASVLPTYWGPWNIDPKDIYTFPDSPLSFLIDEATNTFIHPEKIELPS